MNDVTIPVFLMGVIIGMCMGFVAVVLATKEKDE